jgi:hypothetical protein
MEDSVEVACVAAGLVVGKVGMRELEGTEVFSSGEKIIGLDEARRRIHFWRKMGLKRGFCRASSGLRRRQASDSCVRRSKDATD